MKSIEKLNKKNYDNNKAETLELLNINTFFKESETVNNILGKSLLFLVIIFLLSLNILHSASWFTDDWTYRKKITFTDNTDTIPSQQTDFPVLIRITDENLKNNATDTEYDILFVDSDGITKLSHEIEYYNSGTGELICWVKIPVLDTGVTIFMYYGNSTATDQQDIHNVWDDNYVAVWHMNDSTLTTIKDSANSNLIMEKGGATHPLEEEGKIWKSQYFNNGYLWSDSTPELDEINNHTISAWIYFQGTPNFQYILNKNTTVATDAQFSMITRHTNQRWGAYIDGNQRDFPTSRTWLQNTWKFVTITYNGTHLRGYINGEFYEQVAHSSMSPKGRYLNIGRRSNHIDGTTSSEGLFQGRIDSLKLSNTARSSDWIKTKYNNQNDPSTFYNLSVEQKNTDISINYPPTESYDTNVINITVSGTVVNYYAGDTVEIIVGDNDNPQDTAILSGVGTDTFWVLNITLLNPSDSITIILTDINGNQYFDTITITKTPPLQPTGINATAILQGSETGVLLSWSHNADPDTAGYNIYKTSDPTNFSDTINQFLISDTNYFLDTNVVQGETYFYKIRCIDRVGNKSPQSDSITASSVKIKLSVDTHGRTLPGDTLTLYFNYYNDGFGPAYGANLFYNISDNLLFDTFVENQNVVPTYNGNARIQFEFNYPILPKLESDSKSIEVILRIK